MEQDKVINLWSRAKDRSGNMEKLDQRQLQLEMELRLWRKKLEVKPQEARAEALAKIKMLENAEVRNFNQDDLNRFFSHMMNGVTTPLDYTVSRRA